MTDERALLAPFLDRPRDAGIVLDFDGTLAPIVDAPAAAHLAAGAAEALTAVDRRFALVAVLSGRPVDFLRTVVPEGITLCGLYGLEVLRAGSRHDHPGAGAWREAVADVARSSVDCGPSGMDVEEKGLSLTLHYRRHPEAAGAVEAWARQQATRSGLEARGAKMSVELHPPLAIDKGTALEELAGDLEAVCFVGDDRGDLAAFEALDRLAGRGAHVLRVAVGGAEAPPELVQRADLVLDGPDAVVGFLRSLVPETSPYPGTDAAPDR
ncbi:MAG TPA: trehalose-phosphatase [Acidimicrobiales bacterium]|nr:trehalose-phosphatase [Acidimicrobiales bacterium]